ncbi:MAG: hypothetical protein JST84_25630 [Acidobacteria bacterium]|nr:hypothetical protein [Acidobacteriota bacterium]
MQQPTKSDVRWEWISEGFNLYSAQWQNWIVLALIALVIFGVVVTPFYVLIFGAEFAASRGGDSSDISSVMAGGSLLLRLVLQIVISVVSALLSAGFYRAAFTQLRGGQVSVNDLKEVFQYLGPMLGAGIILGILQGIGTMLCCIPGFIVAGLFMFTYPLIIERNLGMFDAMSQSLDVTKKNFIMFTLLAIVVQFIIPIIGAALCLVGLLVAYPLIFLTIACAYRDCYGLSGGGGNYDSYAPPPPPSYGGYEPPPPPPSSWQ